MDAISYLRSEHNKFRKTLKDISEVSDIEVRKTRFSAFCEELLHHEEMEEEVWYRYLRREYPYLNNIIDHLVEEEKSAAEAMKKFKETSFDFMWKLRFYKFRHDVEHHANEEEEELFPKVEQVLSEEKRNMLGEKMRAFRAT